MVAYKTMYSINSMMKGQDKLYGIEVRHEQCLWSGVVRVSSSWYG